ncbi:1-acyl-sn-glycerol-3-phosphate acyltransferase [Candidatus Koribacter versatilis Ellin345]|uniref:1-acyl-sn-glycerol-3-phosphate acyltransferase n=1 Tax=Koribacter versatilis (strain Ellin345) TaxID=204669 RepID=Q1IND1_KORVE|nr:lysophospholipid acyltransferase family protein [Candidatus Koribacter versatilis]ABF41619.1 1-acyl-sn-glycerol-3-phosphate acyltransferase [Candidatus Koribacter versatilis Ellin345]
MIRTVLVMIWWGVWTVLNGLWGIPYMFITKHVEPLYRAAVWGALMGAKMAGAKITIVGLENIQPGQHYIFMSNHVSNMDPPIVIPLIPGRTSVLVKKELFRIPLLGTAMKLAQLVPVDRSNREAAVASIRAASDVMQHGLHMAVFPEGTRSSDGKMRPLKKGPFYLVEESGAAVIPVTIAGSYEMWPKHRFAITPGPVTLTFHPPITLAQAGGREALMQAVSTAIASALPEDQRGASVEAPEPD